MVEAARREVRQAGPLRAFYERIRSCLRHRGGVASFRSDAEIDWSRARALYRGVYRGREQQKAFWDEFRSTFEDSQLEIHNLTEAGSEVVVWNTAHMWGRDGIEVKARSALVFTVEKSNSSGSGFRLSPTGESRVVLNSLLIGRAVFESEPPQPQPGTTDPARQPETPEPGDDNGDSEEESEGGA